jgi:hypothetical protein
VVEPAENLEDLHAQTEQNRLTFLRTDLELCFTLGGIVEMEHATGDPEHAARTLVLVEKGYTDLKRIFARRSRWEPQTTIEIRENLSLLREMLDRLHVLLGQPLEERESVKRLYAQLAPLCRMNDVIVGTWK